MTPECVKGCGHECDEIHHKWWWVEAFKSVLTNHNHMCEDEYHDREQAKAAADRVRDCRHWREASRASRAETIERCLQTSEQSQVPPSYREKREP